MWERQELYRELVDHRNKDIWKSLEISNSITLAESHEPNYITNFKPGSVTIFIDHSKIDPAYFTHELLHVLLKNNGVDIGEEYNKRIIENDQLFLIFSKDLRDHIGNCLEHIHMLPLYLKLGYEPYKFNSDYAIKKIDDNFMLLLEGRYRSAGSYERVAVDAFIGKYFGAVACNNRAHNYSRFYTRLSRLDCKLFTLLQNFWNDWCTYDFSNPADDFTEMLDIHMDDLIEWTKNKRFI